MPDKTSLPACFARDTSNAGPSTAQCIDVETGKELWIDRLNGGDHWGSVVLAAGRLYVTNQKGITHVFQPNPEKLELLASNDLGEIEQRHPRRLRR